MESFFNAAMLLSSLVLVSLGLLYAYIQKKLRYWKDRNVPFVEPHPLFGNSLDLYNNPLCEVELDRYRKFGKIYGIFDGLKPCITVADPVLLRNILIKDFQVFSSRRAFKFHDDMMDNILAVMKGGEDWKRVRSVISPTFSSGKMRKMIHLVKDCAVQLLDSFQHAVKKGQPVDCKRFYKAFGMDVIARCAFGTRIDSLGDPNNVFVRNAEMVLSQQKMTYRKMLFELFPFLKLYFRFQYLPTEVIDFFRSLTSRIIDQRKANSERHNDFLQLLLDAKEGTLELTEEEKAENAEDEPHLQNIPRGQTLTEIEMFAQCVMFFLAGHDGLSNALTFVTYNLAIHSEVQERLLEEIDSLWESPAGFDYDVIMKLPYLDAVLKETLRIHSVNIRGERVCSEDYVLGDTGLTIPKGMIVYIPVYAMHHDPEFFPEPEKFDPERFLTENKTFPPYTYLPFGEGPRNCIGMRFALMEMKVCLVILLRHFRFVSTEQTKVDMIPGFFLLSSKTMIVNIESRGGAKAK